MPAVKAECYAHNLSTVIRMLSETVDAVSDLAAAISDHMPPQAQGDIAEIQIKLLNIVEEIHKC